MQVAEPLTRYYSTPMTLQLTRRGRAYLYWLDWFETWFPHGDKKFLRAMAEEAANEVD